MYTLNGIMNIAQQSVNNNQIALNVVSNNIANLNTTNYTRQTVDFAAIPPHQRQFQWLWSTSMAAVMNKAAWLSTMSSATQQAWSVMAPNQPVP